MSTDEVIFDIVSLESSKGERPGSFSDRTGIQHNRAIRLSASDEKKILLRISLIKAQISLLSTRTISSGSCLQVLKVSVPTILTTVWKGPTSGSVTRTLLAILGTMASPSRISTSMTLLGAWSIHATRPPPPTVADMVSIWSE